MKEYPYDYEIWIAEIKERLHNVEQQLKEKSINEVYSILEEETELICRNSKNPNFTMTRAVNIVACLNDILDRKVAFENGYCSCRHRFWLDKSKKRE